LKVKLMAAARQVRYGSLDCIVFDSHPEDRDDPDFSSDQPKVAVVLCHGYGAPGHDLAGLAPELIRMIGDAAKAVRFVFPAAPHTLAEQGIPDGRAWWPINMAQLAAAVQSSSFCDLHDLQPPGIDEAREALCETIQAIKAELGGDETPLVLGGFSQGAMLTMDAALRGSIAPPDVLIQFSGSLICQPNWRAALARLADTFVYQSHGTSDPILPFSSAQELHKLLRDGNVRTEFHSFDGPHTIDGDSIAITAITIKGLALKSGS
jgi:phospholipase/carboxylesterase